MPQPVDSSSNPSRRAFLSFVAASPLLAAVGVDRASLTRLLGGSHHDQSAALALITSPSEALNVFDFDAVAKPTSSVSPRISSSRACGPGRARRTRGLLHSSAFAPTQSSRVFGPRVVNVEGLLPGTPQK